VTLAIALFKAKRRFFDFQEPSQETAAPAERFPPIRPLGSDAAATARRM
jgi:hypothetical protein